MKTKLPEPNEQNNFLSGHVELITSSYQRFLGKSLIEPTENMRQTAIKLFHAPFVVVSHDTSDDPIFNYANLTALELFGFNWLAFTSLPSKLSADPGQQEGRERLLQHVAEFGYLTGYEGIRISKSGRRFVIRNATIWNLSHPNGNPAGQAACFAEWRFIN